MIELAALIGAIKTIGAVASAVVAIAAFFALVSKRPRSAFRKILREECDGSVKPVKEDVEKIKGDLEHAKETDLAILRNTITHIYIKYKDTKKIPHYEKENMLYLYGRYEELGGNSYVRQIVNEARDWEEVF